MPKKLIPMITHQDEFSTTSWKSYPQNSEDIYKSSTQQSWMTAHHPAPSYGTHCTSFPAQTPLLWGRVSSPSVMLSETAVPQAVGVQVTAPASKFLQLQNKSCSSHSSSKSLHKVKEINKKVKSISQDKSKPHARTYWPAALPCAKSRDRPQVILSFFLSQDYLNSLNQSKKIQNPSGVSACVSLWEHHFLLKSGFEWNICIFTGVFFPQRIRMRKHINF